MDRRTEAAEVTAQIADELRGGARGKHEHARSAFERLQRLLIAAVGVGDVDVVYEGLVAAATPLLGDGPGSLAALEQCVDLMKRAMLRYLPSVEQLQRIGAWCDGTILAIQAECGGTGGSPSPERQSLMNSLKFLKRLVGRHIDTWNEQHLSDFGTLDSASDPPRASGYPYSAMKQIRDATRGRASSLDALTSLNAPRPREGTPPASHAAGTSGGAWDDGGSERDQNAAFRALLESRTKGVTELAASTRVVLSHMTAMYAADPQKAFVVVSLFLQEMLMDTRSVITQKRYVSKRATSVRMRPPPLPSHSLQSPALERQDPSHTYRRHSHSLLTPTRIIYVLFSLSPPLFAVIYTTI